ncbi:MAG: hypothetical protein FWG27_06725 [Treponema sp.]|nr:hypothetical protein [Treponema sp.]
MAGKSDPSIYDDRTTIGSSDELDEYGVWVKSEPQDLSDSLPDLSDSLPDMEELPDIDSVLADNADLPDFDSSLGSEGMDIPADDSFGSADVEFEEIPENTDLPGGLAPVSVDKDGFTEVLMDDFLETNIDTPESIDIGDLDSAVPEIEALDETPPVIPQDTGNDELNNRLFQRIADANPTSGNADLSNQLLQKIADELSSIKQELSSLKRDLSSVRGEVRTQESAESSGFFDEEDDEKIALTGDELDNILNTANFTEESGSDEGIDGGLSPESAPGQIDIIIDENDLDTADISFGDGLSELDGAVKVEDEIKNIGDDFDISLDLTSDFEESSELNSLREEGAVPITPAPDDTSYLEEDPLASGETIDFSGAVIDEPDLSTGIMENPVSEPVIDDISIDLDMEEPSPGDAAPGSDDFVFETEDTVEIPDADISIPDIPAADDLSFASPFENENKDEPFGTETAASGAEEGIPSNLKQELKTVLSYMDQLLESLPEDKIEEFAKSEYFDTYKKLFEELGLT